MKFEGYETTHDSIRKTLRNDSMLVIHAPNYQAMYDVWLWLDDEHFERVAIGGCENLEEVVEEAESWAEALLEESEA